VGGCRFLQLTKAAHGARQDDVIGTGSQVLHTPIDDIDVREVERADAVTEEVGSSAARFYEGEAAGWEGESQRNAWQPGAGAYIKDSGARVQGDVRCESECRDQVVVIDPPEILQTDQVDSRCEVGEFFSIYLEALGRLRHAIRGEPRTTRGDGWVRDWGGHAPAARDGVPRGTWSWAM
jgi:hypothetical protein